MQVLDELNKDLLRHQCERKTKPVTPTTKPWKMSSKDLNCRCGAFNAEILFHKWLPHRTAWVYGSDVHRGRGPAALWSGRNQASNLPKSRKATFSYNLKEERPGHCFASWIKTEI